MHAERNLSLTRLEDSSFRISDRSPDIRGRKLIDSGSYEIGDVKSLVVDEQAGEVRFLEVRSGGFLGLGGDVHLVPVDAVTSVGEEAVQVDVTRERVLDAPAYEPEVDDPEAYYSDVYVHYGYRPYWAGGRSSQPSRN